MPEEKKLAETITDSDGKILLFSCEQFVKDICTGSCCFICGAHPKGRKFNNEHVFSRWLLARYNLFDVSITLPNLQKHRYGTYRVPCCQSCNQLLGAQLEEPVSALLEGTYKEVAKKFRQPDAQRLLFIWICATFFKIHMKDRFLRQHLDERDGLNVIAENYHWPELHHIHAIARAQYTGAELTPEAFGSILILPVHDPISEHQFDWMDFSDQQTICARIGSIGIVCVLNDAGAASMALANFYRGITGPVTTTQLRELGAKFAMANEDLLTRPVFGTVISKDEPKRVQIWGEPAVIIKHKKFTPETYGPLLAFALRDMLSSIDIDGDRDPESLKSKLMTGRYSFIYNEDKAFRASGIIYQEASRAE